MPGRSLSRPAPQLGETPNVVAVVDDNPAVREFIEVLLPTVGLKVETFGSTQEFIDRMDPGSINCLVLDVRLPGKNGLDFHDDLKRAQIAVPIVFITGYGDVPMAVRAMRGGAVEFLCKPFGGQELLDAVQRGVEQDRRRRDRQAPAKALQASMEELTPRERQVMAQVVTGARNKVIAQVLGISEVTVKAHRRQVMLKMGAATFADLIRMSIRLRDDDG